MNIWFNIIFYFIDLEIYKIEWNWVTYKFIDGAKNFPI